MQRCEELPEPIKDELVKTNLAMRDSANNFFLRYTDPISLGVKTTPAVVYIKKNNETSIVKYLQDIKTQPVSF